jgi:peptidoglycan/xylan/chitin deacetylase (PgdA/CDA1 family)
MAPHSRLACYDLIMKKRHFLRAIVLSFPFFAHAGSSSTPTVSLTIDLCGGNTDMPLLQTLFDYGQPVHLFVTGVWIRRNPDAVKWLMDKQHVFSIENHGLEHHQTSLTESTYQLPHTRTSKEIEREVLDGADLIHKTFGRKPFWYRTAGAHYDAGARTVLAHHHIPIADFHRNLDDGGTASSFTIQKRLAGVQDFDILLAHGNRPHGHLTNALSLWIRETSPTFILLR